MLPGVVMGVLGVSDFSLDWSIYGQFGKYAIRPCYTNFPKSRASSAFPDCRQANCIMAQGGASAQAPPCPLASINPF
jgi:hypothetical protein